MGFKEDFIEGIKGIHSYDIRKKQAFEDAEKLIHDYFTEIYNELEEYLDVAKRNFSFVKSKGNYKVQYDNYLLTINFKGAIINVLVRPMGITYEDQIILDHELMFFSKKHQMALSNELLDTYLKDVFTDLLTIKSGFNN